MRLIDADALIQKRNHAKAYAPDMYVIGQGYVMDAPTIDAVPVVRCRECKNFSPRNLVNFCSRTGRTCENNDYCSYGVKMESEGNT
jgi:hypothetical protein